MYVRLGPPIFLAVTTYSIRLESGAGGLVFLRQISLAWADNVNFKGWDARTKRDRGQTEGVNFVTV